jgi:hypothetical protein
MLRSAHPTPDRYSPCSHRCYERPSSMSASGSNRLRRDGPRCTVQAMTDRQVDRQLAVELAVAPGQGGEGCLAAMTPHPWRVGGGRGALDATTCLATGCGPPCAPPSRPPIGGGVGGRAWAEEPGVLDRPWTPTHGELAVEAWFNSSRFRVKKSRVKAVFSHRHSPCKILVISHETGVTCA